MDERTSIPRSRAEKYSDRLFYRKKNLKMPDKR